MEDVQTGVVTLGGPPLPTGPSEGPPMMDFQRPSAQMQPGQPFPMDNGIPRFYIVAKRMPDGTFVNVERVDILTPGDPKATPSHKVNDAIRARYAPYYELWRRGVEDTPAGTPLELWPVLAPAEVATLKANNIFTVEQLITMADANDFRVPMAKTLKAKAKEWMEQKANADHIEQSRAERDILTGNISRLEAQNFALSDRLDALTQMLAASQGAKAGADDPPPPTKGSKGQGAKAAE